MKKHSPAVLHLVTDALVSAYWFKVDLRSFLQRCGVPHAVTAGFDWGTNGPYKRHIATNVINLLSSNPASGTEVIENIIDSLVEQDDFPQLKRSEDAERKIKEAKTAVDALRKIVGRHSVAERAERARQDNRTEAARSAEIAKQRMDSLAALYKRFQAMAAKNDDPHKRGVDFEKLLRDLFALHDLNPRGSFGSPGEQTDGSLVLDRTYLLVEAKWTKEPMAPDAVRNFRAKVEDKLDSTLGLFVSMSGFTNEAVNRAAQGRRVVILMDGQEIANVFQGIFDFSVVLRQKIRRAAETGDVFFKPMSTL